MHWTRPPIPTTPTEAITAILIHLRFTVAGHGRLIGLASPLLALIHHRIGSMIARFQTLVARGGPAPARAKSTPRNTEPSPAQPAPDALASPPKPRLPTGFAWLFHLTPATKTAPTPAAGPREGLTQLLDDPSIRDLIASDPAFGRLLRPICTMLGIKPPEHLRLPKRPRTPRPQTAHDKFKPTPPRRPRNPTTKPTPHPTYTPPPLYLPPETNVMAFFFPNIFRA